MHSSERKVEWSSSRHRTDRKRLIRRTPRPDRVSIRSWLKTWRRVPGFAVLSFISRTQGKHARMGSVVLDLDDLGAATDKVVELAKSHDVYLRATTVENPPPPGRRGGAKETRALHGLWCDLDHAQGCHAEPSGGLPLPPTPEEALAVIEGLPEPSVVINTSGGFQAWWFFDEPIEIGSHGYEELAELASSWTDMIVRRGAELGFHVDAVRDLARLMRVPGTLNHKWAKERGVSRAVTVRSESGVRYSVEELRDIARVRTHERSAPETGRRRSSGTRVIERWAANISWEDILEPAGFEKSRQLEGTAVEWTRPGNSSSERSAVTDFEGVPVMVVFSENAGLPAGPGQKLTKFRVYAHLYFGGDEAAAARAIREEFGDIDEAGTSLDGSSWLPVDLSKLHDGSYTPPRGSQLSRDDGLDLLYPGGVNGLHGEAESGKSWVAQFACVQALKRGEAVIYIDFDEPNEGAVDLRMQLLGASYEDLESRFHYVMPDEPFHGDHVIAFEGLLEESNPSIVVLDGVTDGMGIHDLDPVNAADFSEFDRLLPRWIARQGPAVLLIDHVAQGRSGAKYAFGSQHKRAAISGASYRVTTTQSFAPGRHGIAKLEIAKDRHGTIRQAAEKVVAEFHLDAANPEAPVAELRMPNAGSNRSSDLRDTAMMEKVSRFIEEAPKPPTVRAIEDGVGGGKTSVNAARKHLIEEGYVQQERGLRNSKVHHAVRPFLGGSDGTSDDRPSVPDRPLDRPSSGGGGVDPVASPRPPVPTGTGTGTRSDVAEGRRSRRHRRIVRHAPPKT